jgi:hypothetical protein
MRRNQVVGVALVLALGVMFLASLAGVASNQSATERADSRTPRMVTTRASGPVANVRSGDTVTGTFARVDVPEKNMGRCAIVEHVRANPRAEPTTETLCVESSKNSRVIARVQNENSHQHELSSSQSAPVMQAREFGCPTGQYFVGDGSCAPVVRGECTDNAYALSRVSSTANLRWFAVPGATRPTVQWWASYVGRPTYLTNTNLLDDYRNSMTNWTNNRNSCGNLRKPKLGSTYMGATQNRPNINITRSSCGSGDARNVVGWMNLSSFKDIVIIGVTCVNYTSTGRITESDIALNNSSELGWVTSGEQPSRAALQKSLDYLRFNVEEVLTHERGHTLGIMHPAINFAKTNNCPGGDFPAGSQCMDAPGIHPDLTMGYPDFYDIEWDTRRSTLGRGDSTALMLLYP